MSLKNTYKIEKSNELNAIRGNNMTLQELRFLSIYLAKINARDVSTRRVRFTLSDFQKIMEIGRMNISHFKNTVNGLLCKVVHMPNDRGGLSSFQIFKEVELFKDDSDSWVVEIDAHDKALSLLFNLKKNYFTYELWNALRLKSVNQLRMYEILKQHEKSGRLEITVSELRESLFISPEQYPKMERFKARVLDSCQQALAENTDISFTYECGKRGTYGRWLTIVFHISRNENYKDPLKLEEFIGDQLNLLTGKPLPIPKSPSSSKRQIYLSGEFEKDLSTADIKILCDMLACKVSKSSERKPALLKKRLKLLYDQMLISSKEPVKSAVKYLKGCIINIDPEDLPSISEKKDDFDVSEYERICINNYEVI